MTIQVKTNLRPKPAGGTGRLALDWWLRQNSPAELVALVDLSEDRIWIFSHEELGQVAQQRPAGRLHFYFYVEDDYRPRIARPLHRLRPVSAVQPRDGTVRCPGSRPRGLHQVINRSLA